MRTFNSMLDCPAIEQEYLLFMMAPEQHLDRIVDFANLWILGFETEFDQLFQAPNRDYLETYAESDDEWYQIYLMRSEAEDHARYGESFDMRNFAHMKDMRAILIAQRLDNINLKT